MFAAKLEEQRQELRGRDIDPATHLNRFNEERANFFPAKQLMDLGLETDQGRRGERVLFGGRSC